MDQQGSASANRPPGASSRESPASAALDRVQAVTERIDGDGEVAADQLLNALALLRELRAELETWEPRLISAARQRGASWADLAPALGVASRQAAERRYLRLRPTEDDAPRQTRDDRVRAERDRRAGERAVARWASDNGADLRQLAGQISALTDLAPAARPSLDRLHDALGGPDPAALVRLLSDTQPHLLADHQALAHRVDAVNVRVDEVRQHVRERRTTGQDPVRPTAPDPNPNPNSEPEPAPRPGPETGGGPGEHVDAESVR